MRSLFLSILGSLLLVSGGWETDFNKAVQTAKQEQKVILLNFSGSDWGGPCIRLHDDVFASKVFTDYASEHLVLVNADFPRLRKHQLSTGQQKKNDDLANLYDRQGIFPMTLLLSA